MPVTTKKQVVSVGTAVEGVGTHFFTPNVDLLYMLELCFKIKGSWMNWIQTSCTFLL